VAFALWLELGFDAVVNVNLAGAKPAAAACLELLWFLLFRHSEQADKKRASGGFTGGWHGGLYMVDRKEHIHLSCLLLMRCKIAPWAGVVGDFLRFAFYGEPPQPAALTANSQEIRSAGGADADDA
jgi:hypothetical protein